MNDDPIDALSLADWRRRVADIYAEVRRTIRSDPDSALAAWRREREALYREHPQSPVPAGSRAAFRARHFSTDPALRFAVAVEPDSAGVEASSAAAGTIPQGFAAAPAQLVVSGGGQMQFRRIGSVNVPFPTGARRLSLFWMEGYAGGLFLPFRDATNGRETYGAGRYLLDAAKSADLGGDGRGTLLLDFNFAYQPSCAFDSQWACPLAPPENWLDIAVAAGERLG